MFFVSPTRGFTTHVGPCQLTPFDSSRWMHLPTVDRHPNAYRRTGLRCSAEVDRSICFQTSLRQATVLSGASLTLPLTPRDWATTSLRLNPRRPTPLRPTPSRPTPPRPNPPRPIPSRPTPEQRTRTPCRSRIRVPIVTPRVPTARAHTARVPTGTVPTAITPTPSQHRSPRHRQELAGGRCARAANAARPGQ